MDELIINLEEDFRVNVPGQADEAVINFSEDIIVKVRQGHEVAVELTHQGPQGPAGAMGDVTPEAIAARDTAVAAKDAAQAARTGAETAQDGAETAEAGAIAARNTAEAHKNAAQIARTGAETAEDNAQTAEANTVAARNASQAAQGLSEAARDKAQDWATEAVDVAVEPGLFSAMHWATKASESATTAGTHKDAAQTAQTGAETARDDSQTARTGSEAARDKAQLWADENEDIAVETGKFSAKHHALKAGADAATAVSAAGDAQQAFSDVTDAIAELGLPATHVASNFLRRNAGNTGFEYLTGTDLRTAIDAQQTLSVVTQLAAEAGTDTSQTGWTAQRVRQAIVAYAAQLVHNHTVDEIDGLQATLDSLAPLNSAVLTGTPTAPTPATTDDSTRLATTAYVRLVVDELVNAAPGTLDTLNELAAALGDDPNFATTMSNELANKADLGHTHVMAEITDLAAELATYAKLNSPALTGNPTAPTQAAGNDSTRLANTAFVKAALDALAATLAPAEHTHLISEITDLQTILDGKWDATSLPATALGKSLLDAATAAAAREILGGSANLSTISQTEAENGASTTARMWTAERVRQAVAAYAAQIIHSHAISDITGLQAALDDKASVAGLQGALDAIDTKADAGLLTGGAEEEIDGALTIDATKNGKVLASIAATDTAWTLEAPATLGNNFLIFISNTGAGDLTVNGTFDDGETEVILEQGQSMALTCNGTVHRLLLRGGGAAGSGIIVPERETIMGDGGAVYTLANTPASKDALLVFVGGVIQSKANFELAGKQITLGGNVAADEKIEVQYLKGGVDTVGATPRYRKHPGTNSAGPFTLLEAPVTPHALTITIGGVVQPKDDLAYTIDGDQILFDEAIPDTTYWEETIIPAVGIAASNLTASLVAADFTGDGTTGPYTLPGEPVSKAAIVELIIGGYPQSTSAIASINGNTMIMSEAIPNGVACSVKVMTQVLIGTPSDETVGAQQIRASEINEIRQKLQISDGVPVGATVFSPTGVVFPGYLELNGSTFDQATWPDLYALLGTNVLPDMRDRVARHAGTLAGAAGTTQNDALETFIIQYGSRGSGNGYGQPAATGADSYRFPWGPSNAGVSSHDQFTVRKTIDGSAPSMASETRVKAYIGKYLIKAGDDIVDNGTVDVAALATSVQGKVNKSDIVGTLTSAGNGRVIERGSNANGEYTKFADGTMICTKMHTVTGLSWSAMGNLYGSSNMSNIALPASFVGGAPIVCAGGTDNGGASWPRMTGYPSSTNFGTFNLMSTGPGNTGTNLHLVAIGRWF